MPLSCVHIPFSCFLNVLVFRLRSSLFLHAQFQIVVEAFFSHFFFLSFTDSYNRSLFYSSTSHIRFTQIYYILCYGWEVFIFYQLTEITSKMDLLTYQQARLCLYGVCITSLTNFTKSPMLIVVSDSRMVLVFLNAFRFPLAQTVLVIPEHNCKRTYKHKCSIFHR